jgi:hypothetical protein
VKRLLKLLAVAFAGFMVGGWIADGAGAGDEVTGWIALGGAALAVVLWLRYRPRVSDRARAARIEQWRPKAEELRKNDLRAYKEILDVATEPLAFTDPDAYVGLKLAERGG